jgi:hypothetical protein
MWLNISKSPSHNPKKHLRMSVDCAGANRGLFFGIFMLVGTIISLIVFFVLVDKPHMDKAAVIVVHASEIVIYCLAFIVVIIASFKIGVLNSTRTSTIRSTGS